MALRKVADAGRPFCELCNDSAAGAVRKRMKDTIKVSHIDNYSCNAGRVNILSHMASCFLQHQLGLRDERDEFAVGVADPRLPDRRAPAHMQGRRLSRDGLPFPSGSKEIRLAFDRRRARTLR